MHTYHQKETVPFLTREGGKNKTIQVPVLKGFNPTHRRMEICDEGFVSRKSSYA